MTQNNSQGIIFVTISCQSVNCAKLSQITLNYVKSLSSAEKTQISEKFQKPSG